MKIFLKHIIKLFERKKKISEDKIKIFQEVSYIEAAKIVYEEEKKTKAISDQLDKRIKDFLDNSKTMTF